MEIKFGPAGFGGVSDAEENLKEFAGLGLRACEVAFTYQVYIKDKEVGKRIGALAQKLGISLSIHAPYFVNLNSSEKIKREATKRRILDCCRVGKWLGAKLVVFHPGFYGDNKAGAFDVIKEGILEMQAEIRRQNWKVKLAPETMGKVNVFGSVEEISKLVRETGCSFCLDFAHVLAREKELDWDKIRRLFPSKEWHCHFSGIEYGEKGERRHKSTLREDWLGLFGGLKGFGGKKIVIINESPTMVEDCVEGLGIWERLKNNSVAQIRASHFPICALGKR